MKIIDSHCHIHDKDFPIELSEVFDLMYENSVKKAICVGVDVENSKRAVEFCEAFEKNHKKDEVFSFSSGISVAQQSEAHKQKEEHGDFFGDFNKPQLFAAVGIHPHEAEKVNFETDFEELRTLAQTPKVVAIGEIGLDYFYDNSPREIQQKVLFEQLKIAFELNLPVSFHVRNAFDDFWRVLNDFESQFGKVRGVLHSYTDSFENLERAINRGFYIGVNGISTFVKKPEELEMFAQIPLEKTLLETDAPYLAPKGKRGKKNQPAWTRLVIEDLAKKRGISPEKVAEITSKNAEELFGI